MSGERAVELLRRRADCGPSKTAATRGDGASRTGYIHVHAKYLGKDRFRVKTFAA